MTLLLCGVCLLRKSASVQPALSLRKMAPYSTSGDAVAAELSDDGVLVVTVRGGAPPRDGSPAEAADINVITSGIMRGLIATFNAAAEDDAVRVLVLRSADPDFFLAHYDVAAIGTNVGGPEPERKSGPTEHGFHRMCNSVREMPKPCIAAIGGRVGGGGSELCLNFDMRFGVRGKYTLCQMEVPLGILPGGSGTVTLPRLVGAGRAMEIILSGDDIDAETAERWGILNRAFPDAAAMDAHVDALAARLASLPPSAVAAAKASVVNGADMSREDALHEEDYQFQQTLRDPAAKEKMDAFLAHGGQTRAGELDLQGTMVKAGMVAKI